MKLGEVLIPNKKNSKSNSITDDFKLLIKKSAPLARDSWRIYITKMSDRKLEYGVFSELGYPFRLRLDDLMDSPSTNDYKFMRIVRYAHDSVEISNNNNEKLIIHFTTHEEQVDDEREKIQKIAKCICSGVNRATLRNLDIEKYVERLIYACLRDSHGSLIAVVSPLETPDFLSKDCTLIDPAIDMLEPAITASVKPDNIYKMHAIESLIKGIFNCDGIVVISSDAKIIAYRSFLKLKSNSVAGGARKRAYKGLCEYLSDPNATHLIAAFYRSQDGATEFSGRH